MTAVPLGDKAVVVMAQKSEWAAEELLLLCGDGNALARVKRRGGV
jgi:hypothetical protein